MYLQSRTLTALMLMTSGVAAPSANSLIPTEPADQQIAQDAISTSKVVTSEEVRLSELGRGNLPIRPGRRYRVVGKVRSVEATGSGLPLITFTGLHAALDQGVSRESIESLEPGAYVSVDCIFTKPSDDIFPLLDRCTGLRQLPVISAAAYEDAYSANPLRADSKLKDRQVIIFGEVRLISNLVDGRPYVSFHAQKNFSDVTAIISPEAKHMMSEYARVGKAAVMFCYGGFLYNQAGSVGLNNCRFLQNY